MELSKESLEDLLSSCQRPMNRRARSMLAQLPPSGGGTWFLETSRTEGLAKMVPNLALKHLEPARLYTLRASSPASAWLDGSGTSSILH